MREMRTSEHQMIRPGRDKRLHLRPHLGLGLRAVQLAALHKSHE